MVVIRVGEVMVVIRVGEDIGGPFWKVIRVGEDIDIDGGQLVIQVGEDIVGDILGSTNQNHCAVSTTTRIKLKKV